MTSLSQQLAHFRRERAAARVDNDPRREAARSSLMFTREVAQDMDHATVLELARDGLSQLVRIDPALGSYFENLFHEDAVRTHRSSMTTEQSAALSGTICSFLAAIAPHALLTPAHQCVEFLLRHHSINTDPITVDAFIRVFIPHHNTALFAKVLKLATLKETVWEFMITFANGHPVSAGAFIPVLMSTPARLAVILAPYIADPAAPANGPIIAFAPVERYAAFCVTLAVAFVEHARRSSSAAALPERAIGDIIAFANALMSFSSTSTSHFQAARAGGNAAVAAALSREASNLAAGGIVVATALAMGLQLQPPAHAGLIAAIVDPLASYNGPLVVPVAVSEAMTSIAALPADASATDAVRLLRDGCIRAAHSSTASAAASAAVVAARAGAARADGADADALYLRIRALSAIAHSRAAAIQREVSAGSGPAQQSISLAGVAAIPATSVTATVVGAFRRLPRRLSHRFVEAWWAACVPMLCTVANSQSVDALTTMLIGSAIGALAQGAAGSAAAAVDAADDDAGVGKRIPREGATSAPTGVAPSAASLGKLAVLRPASLLLALAARPPSAAVVDVLFYTLTEVAAASVAPTQAPRGNGARSAPVHRTAIGAVAHAALELLQQAAPVRYGALLSSSLSTVAAGRASSGTGGAAAAAAALRALPGGWTAAVAASLSSADPRQRREAVGVLTAAAATHISECATAAAAVKAAEGEAAGADKEKGSSKKKDKARVDDAATPMAASSVAAIESAVAASAEAVERLREFVVFAEAALAHALANEAALEVATAWLTVINDDAPAAPTTDGDKKKDKRRDSGAVEAAAITTPEAAARAVLRAAAARAVARRPALAIATGGMLWRAVSSLTRATPTAAASGDAPAVGGHVDAASLAAIDLVEGVFASIVAPRVAASAAAVRGAFPAAADEIAAAAAAIDGADAAAVAARVCGSSVVAYVRALAAGAGVPTRATAQPSAVGAFALTAADGARVTAAVAAGGSAAAAAPLSAAAAAAAGAVSSALVAPALDLAVHVAGDVAAPPAVRWAAGVASTVLLSSHPSATVAATVPVSSWAAVAAAPPAAAAATMGAAIAATLGGIRSALRAQQAAAVSSPSATPVAAEIAPAVSGIPLHIPGALLASAAATPAAAPIAAMAIYAFSLAAAAARVAAVAVAQASHDVPPHVAVAAAGVLGSRALAIVTSTKGGPLLGALCEGASSILGPALPFALSACVAPASAAGTAATLAPYVSAGTAGGADLAAVATAAALAAAPSSAAPAPHALLVGARALLSYSARTAPTPTGVYVTAVMAALLDATTTRFAVRALAAIGAECPFAAQLVRALVEVGSPQAAAAAAAAAAGSAQVPTPSKGSSTPTGATVDTANAADLIAAPVTVLTLTRALSFVTADAADWDDVADLDIDNDVATHSPAAPSSATKAAPRGGARGRTAARTSTDGGIAAAAGGAITSLSDGAARLPRGPSSLVAARLALSAAATRTTAVLDAIVQSWTAATAARIAPRVTAAIIASAKTTTAASAAVAAVLPCRAPIAPAAVAALAGASASAARGDDVTQLGVVPVSAAAPAVVAADEDVDASVLAVLTPSLIRPYVHGFVSIPAAVVDAALLSLAASPSLRAVAAVAASADVLIAHHPARSLVALTVAVDSPVASKEVAAFAADVLRAHWATFVPVIQRALAAVATAAGTGAAAPASASGRGGRGKTTPVKKGAAARGGDSESDDEATDAHIIVAPHAALRALAIIASAPCLAASAVAAAAAPFVRGVDAGIVLSPADTAAAEDDAVPAVDDAAEAALLAAVIAPAEIGAQIAVGSLHAIAAAAATAPAAMRDDGDSDDDDATAAADPTVAIATEALGAVMAVARLRAYVADRVAAATLAAARVPSRASLAAASSAPADAPASSGKKGSKSKSAAQSDAASYPDAVDELPTTVPFAVDVAALLDAAAAVTVAPSAAAAQCAHLAVAAAASVAAASPITALIECADAVTRAATTAPRVLPATITVIGTVAAVAAPRALLLSSIMSAPPAGFRIPSALAAAIDLSAVPSVASDALAAAAHVAVSAATAVAVALTAIAAAAPRVAVEAFGSSLPAHTDAAALLRAASDGSVAAMADGENAATAAIAAATASAALRRILAAAPAGARARVMAGAYAAVANAAMCGALAAPAPASGGKGKKGSAPSAPATVPLLPPAAVAQRAPSVYPGVTASGDASALQALVARVVGCPPAVAATLAAAAPADAANGGTAALAVSGCVVVPAASRAVAAALSADGGARSVGILRILASVVAYVDILAAGATGPSVTIAGDASMSLAATAAAAPTAASAAVAIQESAAALSSLVTASSTIARAKSGAPQPVGVFSSTSAAKAIGGDATVAVEVTYAVAAYAAFVAAAPLAAAAAASAVDGAGEDYRGSGATAGGIGLASRAALVALLSPAPSSDATATAAAASAAAATADAVEAVCGGLSARAVASLAVASLQRAVGTSSNVAATATALRDVASAQRVAFAAYLINSAGAHRAAADGPDAAAAAAAAAAVPLLVGVIAAAPEACADADAAAASGSSCDESASAVAHVGTLTWLATSGAVSAASALAAAGAARSDVECVKTVFTALLDACVGATARLAPQGGDAKGTPAKKGKSRAASTSATAVADAANVQVGLLCAAATSALGDLVETVLVSPTLAAAGAAPRRPATAGAIMPRVNDATKALVASTVAVANTYVVVAAARAAAIAAASSAPAKVAKNSAAATKASAAARVAATAAAATQLETALCAAYFSAARAARALGPLLGSSAADLVAAAAARPLITGAPAVPAAASSPAGARGWAAWAAQQAASGAITAPSVLDDGAAVAPPHTLVGPRRAATALAAAVVTSVPPRVLLPHLLGAARAGGAHPPLVTSAILVALTRAALPIDAEQLGVTVGEFVDALVAPDGVATRAAAHLAASASARGFDDSAAAIAWRADVVALLVALARGVKAPARVALFARLAEWANDAIGAKKSIASAGGAGGLGAIARGDTADADAADAGAPLAERAERARVVVDVILCSLLGGGAVAAVAVLPAVPSLVKAATATATAAQWAPTHQSGLSGGIIGSGLTDTVTAPGAESSEADRKKRPREEQPEAVAAAAPGGRCGSNLAWSLLGDHDGAPPQWPRSGAAASFLDEESAPSVTAAAAAARVGKVARSSIAVGRLRAPARVWHGRYGAYALLRATCVTVGLTLDALRGVSRALTGGHSAAERVAAVAALCAMDVPELMRVTNAAAAAAVELADISLRAMEGGRPSTRGVDRSGAVPSATPSAAAAVDGELIVAPKGVMFIAPLAPRGDKVSSAAADMRKLDVGRHAQTVSTVTATGSAAVVNSLVRGAVSLFDGVACDAMDSIVTAVGPLVAAAVDLAARGDGMFAQSAQQRLVDTIVDPSRAWRGRVGALEALRMLVLSLGTEWAGSSGVSSAVTVLAEASNDEVPEVATMARVVQRTIEHIAGGVSVFD